MAKEDVEFPTTFVINLAERKKRLYTVKREFSQHGWPVPLERVAGIKLKDGVEGCRRSHAKSLGVADERGLPWVLILEDDTKLRRESLARFKRLLPELWERRDDYDIFLGAVSHLRGKTRKLRGGRDPLYKVRGYSTHFCLVPAHAYKKLINLINTQPGPVDVVYSNHARLWTTCPYLATQHATISSITHKFADHDLGFRRNERRLCGAERRRTRK